MARILDVLQQSTPKGQRVPDAPAPPRDPLPADEPLDDDCGVPFIEVGATAVSSQPRLVRNLPPAPTIIPMPRPARADALRLAPVDDFALYRISFQPLPFPEHPDGPASRRFARELVALHQPEHEVSEQYRKLLADLEAQLGANTAKSLLFTSALSGAGTTTVLLNLAITCARRAAARVVVVDANIERPAIAQRLGAAAAPGLREVLARTVPLAWSLQESGQANLTVLPAGALAGESAMDLWPIALDQLSQRFDWVLIDGAACARPEWPALAGTATATYLVMRQADLEKPELNDLLSDVPRLGGRLRGYILTQR